MSTRIRPTLASAIGALLTGTLLTMTAVGQSTYGNENKDKTDMQRKHAACEHMKGQKQIDCEKRMTAMDKKSQADSDKPADSTPPK